MLGTFDAPLREYAANKLHKQGVHLVKVTVLLLGLLLEVMHIQPPLYAKLLATSPVIASAYPKIGNQAGTPYNGQFLQFSNSKYNGQYNGAPGCRLRRLLS